MARIDPERAAALYAKHQRLAPVADIMGVSVPGLWLCLKRHGVPVVTRTESMKALHADPEFKAKISKLSAARMKALNADPEFKAAAAARMKALHADPEFKAKIRAARRVYEVPAWVPTDLIDDYIDVARLSGEEGAASHVRRLKREAAQ